ncbi:MaoC family dehydratase [Candidatus Neomarinimicrobiota bacterium]
MADNLKIGDSATLTKAFSSEEVNEFAKLSLDNNPIHLDEDFATASMFGQRIVHGMLVASLFSGLLGQKLPGVGSIYLGQKLSFKVPVIIGEEVTASVEIIDIRNDKPIVTLKTVCANQAGKTVIDGEAVVMIPR